jgi:hypothetical protein
MKVHNKKERLQNENQERKHTIASAFCIVRAPGGDPVDGRLFF